MGSVASSPSVWVFSVSKPGFWFLWLFPLGLGFLITTFYYASSVPAPTSPTRPSYFLWPGSDPVLIPSRHTSILEFLLPNKLLVYTYSLYTYNLSFLCFIKILNICFKGYIPVTSLVHRALTSSPGPQMVPPCLCNTCLLATSWIFLCFPFLILRSTETWHWQSISFRPSFNMVQIEAKLLF